MSTFTRRCVVLFAWLGLASVASAQTAFRHDLLALVPDDFAVCIVVHDWRGHAARWEQSDWIKVFRQSPLHKTILDAPEMKQLGRWHDDLKKHFDLDWPTLRDDVLGDTVILAYKPPSQKNPADEQGLFLLHARKPERLVHLVDRLNDRQTKSGELKSLAVLEHKGTKYHRREEAKKTQYYFLDGPLFAFTDKHDVLRAFLERRAAARKEHPWAKRFQRAGAEQALVTMCVDPSRLALDFGQNAKAKDALPTYWKALEAIFVTLTIENEAELRVVIQADAKKLPELVRDAFSRTVPASTLWQRFPEQSILTIAARTNFAGTAEGLKVLLPKKDHKDLADEWQRQLAVLLGVDLKEVLLSVGPDWGICVLPARKASELPQALIAVAVKPDEQQPDFGGALFTKVQKLTEIAVEAYNQRHPKSKIRLQTLTQGKVTVVYLAHDALFPAGMQPACALKDGFLLFATSPEVIEQFRLHEGKTPLRKDTPLVRMSAPELATLLHNRREQILGNLTAGQTMSERDAKKNLESVIALLRLFDQMTLSQHGEAGQATWTLRLSPAPPKRTSK